MEYTIIGDKEKERRTRLLSLIVKHDQGNFMSLIHNEEAHKICLNPDPGVHITDFFVKAKDIFDEYPGISAKVIFNWYLEDEKNGVKRIKWDVIPVEQYANLLQRYMEMGEFARIPRDVVYGWYQKIKRNVVILYYLSYMYYRKYGFPFEIVPFETTDTIKAQMWLVINTNFYSWARFENGGVAYTDRAFEELFPLLREYRDDMTAGEILILINKLIHVVHMRSKVSDISLAFIEGGVKSCDKITNG